VFLVWVGLGGGGWGVFSILLVSWGKKKEDSNKMGQTFERWGREIQTLEKDVLRKRNHQIPRETQQVREKKNIK